MGHTLAHGLGGNNQADKYTVEQLRTNIHRNNPCMPAYHTIPCHTIAYYTIPCSYMCTLTHTYVAAFGVTRFRDQHKRGRATSREFGVVSGLGSLLSTDRIWEVPEIRGTLFWGPYYKDPTNLGTILGSPVLGNSHLHLGVRGAND